MSTQAFLLWVREHRLLAGGGVAALGLIVVVIVVVLAVSGGGNGDDVGVTADGTRTPTARVTATSTPRQTGTPPPDETRTATPRDGTPTATLAPGQPTTTNPPPPPGATATQPPSQPSPTRRPPPTGTRTPVPLSISIVAPAQGATVSPTFTMQVAVTGIQLQVGPGGQLPPGFGHWHLGIDTVLQQQARGATSVQIGPLSPGQHTLTATLNLNDADQTTVAIAQVTITVR